MLADLASSVGVMISAIAIYAFECFWLDGTVTLLIALFVARSAVSLIGSTWQEWSNRSPRFNDLTLLEIGRTNFIDLIVHKSD